MMPHALRKVWVGGWRKPSLVSALRAHCSAPKSVPDGFVDSLFRHHPLPVRYQARHGEPRITQGVGRGLAETVPDLCPKPLSVGGYQKPRRMPT